MSGCTKSVDFGLLKGAGLDGVRTKARTAGYDARFVDWVMVRRGFNRRDGVNKGYCIAKVQGEYGAVSSIVDAERVAALIMGSSYQASTKRHKLEALEDWCTFLGFEAKFHKPRADHRLPSYLTQEQMGQLVHAVRDYREYAIITTFVFTGMRLSEVVGLNLGDVSFDTKLIQVRNTKNGRDRSVPLADGLGAMLREYKYRRGMSGLSPESPLFVGREGGRLGGHQMQRIVGNVAKRAGLPHVHVHMLRHSFASAWVSNGGDLFHLQQVLGHSNFATTMIYLHTDRATLRRAYETAMPRL